MSILSVLTQCSGLTFPGRAGPITCLLQSDTSEGEITATCPLLPMAGRRTTLRSLEQETWPWPSTQEASPTPHLGSTVVLALDVGIVGGPGPKGVTGRASPVSYLLGVAWMSLSLAIQSRQKSWIWSHKDGKTGPVPCLGSRAELALVEGWRGCC